MSAPWAQDLLTRQLKEPPGSGGGAHRIRVCISTQVISTGNKPLVVHSGQDQLQEPGHTTIEDTQGTGQAQGSNNSLGGMMASTPKSRLHAIASAHQMGTWLG